MSRKTQRPLPERVASAADSLLAAQGEVDPIHVFMVMGWTEGGTVRRWQQGQVGSLEEVIQTRPERIAEALELLRSFATEHGLIARETPYVAANPGRKALRFSRSGEDALERAWRTHWVSPALSGKQRERRAAKAGRAPELVVVVPLHDWTCHRCGGSGDFLMMENGGPACLPCAGLGDLEFLGAGDALLTRRAKAKSARYAVVVRFSKTRGRYERRGLMLEPKAIAEAEREIAQQR